MRGRGVQCPVCLSPRIPMGMMPAHIGGERCLRVLRDRPTPVTPTAARLLASARVFREAIDHALREQSTTEAAHG